MSQQTVDSTVKQPSLKLRADLFKVIYSISEIVYNDDEPSSN